MFWGVLEESIGLKMFNPFDATVPILYPLKTFENLWFSDVFRKYKEKTLSLGVIKTDQWYEMG